MENKPSKNGLLGRIETEADESLNPVLEFILKHIVLIGIVVGLIILGVGGFTLYSSYQKTKSTEALDQLAAILTKEKGQDKIQSLQDFIKEGSSSLKTRAQLELCNVLMENEEYEKAAEIWTDLEDTSEGNLRIISSLGRAETLTKTGNPEQALTILETTLEKAPASYEVPILRQIAETAELAQNYDRSLEAYKKIKDAASEDANTDFIQYKIDQLSKQIG